MALTSQGEQANFMDDIDRRTNLAFSNEMEMLTFFLTDGQLYGLNVFKIIEILECPKTVTRMPHAHAAVVGAIDFRGHAVPLIDLSYALGMEATDRSVGVSYVLICEYSTTTQGLLISRPNMLIHKSWDDVNRPEGSLYDTTYLTAITYHDDQPVQILDVEKILSEIIGIDDTVATDLVEKGQHLVMKEHHILAVDDSKAARSMIHSALEQLGIQHTLFDNAASALEALEASVADGQTCPYTIVFSDIEMPIMDGFTFTRKVKANPKLAGIYLALHSSLSNKSNEHKAKQMGADGFIPKFQPNLIVGTILEQLEKAAGH
ncbi:MAG: chemotaxis protein CheV [Magnetococcales bacterium]|nr:chemotaxis protein CheV [Magnetococcales bacterium]